MPAKNVNDVIALCKRRGFIFTGSEIYGGMGGTYDYGPYGVELMKNIRETWWNTMVYSRDDVEGLDASLITNRLLWKYSGHEAGFSDPLVECKKCGARMRQDKMKDVTKCDACGSADLMAASINLLPESAYILSYNLWRTLYSFISETVCCKNKWR